jgi:hypothetical protein
MSIENQEPKEKSSIEVLADNLDKLQASKNDGRGISCVRTLVMYLRRGDIESAKAVCLNEGDKIRNYPDIKELLETELMDEKS